MIDHPVLFGLLSLLVAPLALSAPSARGRRSGSEPPPSTGDDVRALHALFEEEWEWTLEQFPTFATVVGDPRYNDRWPEMSVAALEKRKAHGREILARVEAIDRSRLPEAEQLNYDLFRREISLQVEGFRFPDDYLPVNQMTGVHQDVADILQLAPKGSVRDLEDIVKRLEAVPTLVDQTTALMRAGLEMGLTPPRVALRQVGTMIGNHVVGEPSQSPIGQIALRGLPPDLDPEAVSQYRDGVIRALREAVIPSYREFGRFFTEEYYPRARASIGLSDLPDGTAWYDYRVRLMTTSELSAEEIHQIGMTEVERIRSEMVETMGRTGFEGTLGEFFDYLRSDPRFFFTDKNLLLMTYRDIAKRIDPGLPKIFATLPRLTYGIVPVPDYSEKVQTTAYYYPGSLEAGRPGYFFANTYDLTARPKWEMEALAAHEAVPGHHLQIALAQELQDLPKFRRFGGNTAFVEGWALYAESLGRELGLYEDPHSEFGRLTYEMWRAIRLVVDTGIHAKGWTRDKAIAFFQENAGKAGHDIAVEVDRYIVWPAQALAYKIGELKIKELRARAIQELGSRFDIREFHDLILGAGPLPLPTLQARVGRWIAERRTRQASS